jgi:hypothetical protein
MLMVAFHRSSSHGLQPSPPWHVGGANGCASSNASRRTIGNAGGSAGPAQSNGEVLLWSTEVFAAQGVLRNLALRTGFRPVGLSQPVLEERAAQFAVHVGRGRVSWTRPISTPAGSAAFPTDEI